MTLALIIAAGDAAHATPDVFGYTGALQNYPITQTGIYHIEVNGAQGAHGDGAAGLGLALLGGDIILNSGTVLDIIVGGRGLNGTSNPQSGGGGGGSFVYAVGSTLPLVVAGGGGGGGFGQGAGGGGLIGPDGGQGGGSKGVAPAGQVAPAAGAERRLGDPMAPPAAAGLLTARTERAVCPVRMAPDPPALQAARGSAAAMVALAAADRSSAATSSTC